VTWLANIAYLLAGIGYLPVLVFQMLVQARNRRGWREKFCGPRPEIAPVNSSAAIWLHAVSLGEINAARSIVAGLRERCPDQAVLVSTTTDTGYDQAVKLFGADRVFRYPLDLSWTVTRALDRIRPAAIVLVELEVWFNLVTIAARRGIPVCVVNGRLTERSCRRFGWIAPIARRMFTALRWVGAQDAATAERFVRVGVPPDRITVTGSVKWDTAAVADRVAGQDELAAALGIRSDRPLWVCGSTGPDEESLLLDACADLRAVHPALQLALVPRKPERFNEVADLITRRGYPCIRRSRHPDGTAPAPTAGASSAPGPDSKPAVILGDTMGELRKFYALASVVFVGRSLVPLGGSDPMEVAALGKPVVTGPHMENFAQPVQVLAACGALVQAPDILSVKSQVQAWLTDPAKAAQAASSARTAVISNQGATGRTLEALARLLNRPVAATQSEPKTQAPGPYA